MRANEKVIFEDTIEFLERQHAAALRDYDDLTIRIHELRRLVKLAPAETEALPGMGEVTAITNETPPNP